MSPLLFLLGRFSRIRSEGHFSNRSTRSATDPRVRKGRIGLESSEEDWPGPVAVGRGPMLVSDERRPDSMVRDARPALETPVDREFVSSRLMGILFTLAAVPEGSTLAPPLLFDFPMRDWCPLPSLLFSMTMPVFKALINLSSSLVTSSKYSMEVFNSLLSDNLFGGCFVRAVFG